MEKHEGSGGKAAAKIAAANKKRYEAGLKAERKKRAEEKKRTGKGISGLKKLLKG